VAALQAAELGVGSMMCFQLFVAGDQLGALNMYSRTRGHMPSPRLSSSMSD
jgi:hypothetical protein